MGIMVYSFLWVVQDLYHQPYDSLSNSILPGFLPRAHAKIFLRTCSFHPGSPRWAVRQLQHRFKSRDLVREDFCNVSPGSAESEVSSRLSAAKGEKFIIGHTTPTCTLCRWYIIHKGRNVKMLQMAKQRLSYSRYTDISTANKRNRRLLLNHQ